MNGWCQIQSHHVPSYITYQFRNHYQCGVVPSPPQLIEIFINISLTDIYPQQKQESQRVFQDQNKSVHKRVQKSVMRSLRASSGLIIKQDIELYETRHVPSHSSVDGLR